LLGSLFLLLLLLLKYRRCSSVSNLESPLYRFAFVIFHTCVNFGGRDCYRCGRMNCKVRPVAVLFHLNHSISSACHLETIVTTLAFFLYSYFTFYFCYFFALGVFFSISSGDDSGGVKDYRIEAGLWFDITCNCQM